MLVAKLAGSLVDESFEDIAFVSGFMFAVVVEPIVGAVATTATWVV